MLANVLAIRLFLPIALWAFAISSACGASTYLELGPMVGHTSANEARIWIKASGPARFGVLISEQEDLSKARTVKGPALTDRAEFMDHLAIDRLKPNTRYYYTPLLDGKPALARPYPSFMTAPADGANTRLRFAFVSCLGRKGFDAAAAWGDLESRTNIHLLLMLGDNHYADSTEPAKQRAAYYSHRHVPAYTAITERTPTYAIWDDHDFGPNDSDANAEGKEKSLRTFKEFWANPAYGEAENPGVYHRFSRGNIDFFMVDCRYHRSPNRAPQDEKKTMLGEKQLAWLKKELLASKAAVKFLASGSEWQSNGHQDSWTSFARERQEILDFIETNRITGVIFLSGDRHFTAGYQIRDRWIEVTSGPLGSSNAVVKNVPPEMFFKYDDGKIYAIFDVDTTGTTPVVGLEVYRAGTGLLEQRTFSWEEITGAKKIPRLGTAQTNR